MNQATCESIRERIPDVAAGRTAPTAGFDAHLETCADCRTELRLAGLVFDGRPVAPSGASDRVVGALRRRRRVVQRPWWGISAAAAAALALGIGITSEPAPTDGFGAVTDYAAGEDTELWLSDDGLMAGAPALDILSDEDLVLLLEELSGGATGGAA